jgi:lipopolysaccharide assembly outer membrane protein LptD (OstA)
MKKQLAAALILAPLAIALPFAASARDSLGSYAYIEGGFKRLSIDSEVVDNFDFDGAYLRGSAELSDNLSLHGGLAWSQSSDLPVDVDALEAEIGLGYRYNFADNVDLIADATYQRQEFDDGSDKDARNNTRIGIGVRGALTNSLEGWVKANYVDGGAYEGDVVGTLGVHVVLSQTWGLVGEVDAGGDVSRFNLGVRASF